MEHQWAGSICSRQSQKFTRCLPLAYYRIDLAILTEAKHHGVSYEEEYEVSGTEYKLFFAVPENGERNHHGVTLAVKAALWADWGSQ